MRGDDVIDRILTRLADRYRQECGSSGNVFEAVRTLYIRYVKEKGQTILEAVAVAAAVDALFLADSIDYSKITPQMEEAFRLAYPGLEFNDLARMSPEEIQGVLSGWKGKYFEVIVRDRLNGGEWVGDLHLEPGQTAVLAESPTQPGWDLKILNPDGTEDFYLQLKATDSLGYVKEALEGNPDIPLVVTDEIATHAQALSGGVFASGVSDAALERDITAPVDGLLDSPTGELAEAIFPVAPFLLIAASEGRQVMAGHKTPAEALAAGLNRGVKSGVAMGIGGLLCLLGAGILSLPVAFVTRTGWSRSEVVAAAARALESRILFLRRLRGRYAR